MLYVVYVLLLKKMREPSSPECPSGAYLTIPPNLKNETNCAANEHQTKSFNMSSSTERLQLSGVGTALITPFTANGEKVDYEAFGKLIDSQLAAGLDFLVPMGTTGECPVVTDEEYEQIVKFTVERVAGRIPVVAGTGSNNTAKAVKATKLAKKLGADAALIVNPYYNKPSQEGLYQHFKTICTEAKLPVVLYNIPGRTGITMQPKQSQDYTMTSKRLLQLKKLPVPWTLQRNCRALRHSNSIRRRFIVFATYVYRRQRRC